MTWIHCSIKDGSCVALTADENFSFNNVSRKMRAHYFHVRVTDALNSLLPLIATVEDASGNLLHKFRGFVDIDTVLSTEIRSDVRDPNIEVSPISTPIRLNQITERI